MGRRIEKNVNGTITAYVYDNEAIILAYNAAGNIKAKYTHGPSLDEPLAVKKSDDIYYYHADGLGSIVALTDATGAVVETYSYDSFGKMTKTGNINQPFTYTGREFDSETGLYYYRARYYDAKAGRFLQRDPIREFNQETRLYYYNGRYYDSKAKGFLQEDPIGFDMGNLNFYVYVANNPVNKIDPQGLSACSIGCFIAATVPCIPGCHWMWVAGPTGPALAIICHVICHELFYDRCKDTFCKPKSNCRK